MEDKRSKLSKLELKDDIQLLQKLKRATMIQAIKYQRDLGLVIALWSVYPSSNSLPVMSD
jgi:hypothetical protein